MLEVLILVGIVLLVLGYLFVGYRVAAGINENTNAEIDDEMINTASIIIILWPLYLILNSKEELDKE